MAESSSRRARRGASPTEPSARPDGPASARPAAPADRPGGNPRHTASAARREAILAAALDEFSARGFAAARLDDVARRAGVAKGTIYVHFRDKETLFEE